MKLNYRSRRLIAVGILALAAGGWLILSPLSYEQEIIPAQTAQTTQTTENAQTTETAEDTAIAPLGVSTDGTTNDGSQKLAKDVLETLEIKGRAPKTGYDRSEMFYSSWPTVNGCSLRQIIIKREVGDSAEMDGCDVIKGTFTEPYTGKTFTATQKSDFSKGIQIDHVVALSDAWQKGAQQKTQEERYALATDPLNLLAVDASANQQKSDGDAATWLPPNKAFRCQYVARQVSVKSKYALWVTEAEHDTIAKILETCPGEPAVGI